MNTTRFLFRTAAWFLTTLALVSCQASAAVLTVTNLADSGPGTLRDRIVAAAPGDTINFALNGTITLNSQLTISKDLRIEGQTFLTVSGNNNNRVFNITSGSAQIFTLGISDGRVVGTNGPAGANGENVYGAGIFVADGASLLIQSCVFSNNVTRAGQGGSEGPFGMAGNGGNAYGGAISSLGSLSLSHCIFAANSASGGLGGVAGPMNSPGVGGQGWGGAVYAEGTAAIYSSAIYENNAIAGAGGGGPGSGAGGGIYNAATMQLGTSTIVSNRASGSSFDSGGGIASNGALTVRDCTIAGNEADFGGGMSGVGNFANTILALNSASSGTDGSGTLTSSGYNLIQNTNGLFIDGATAQNIIGQNPLLGPLADNGGGTLTMVPLAGSPVIDKGKSTLSDQRFRPRPYDGSIPNAVGGNGADIGAVEIHPGTLTVLNTNNSGGGSLRQAVIDNDGLGGSNTIIFSGSVTGVITLTSGELFVNAPAIVRGPGADRLAVSGNTNGRVLSVLEGPTQISGLTIRDGMLIGDPGNQERDGFDAYGGGIYNLSTLTLSNCVIRNNTVMGGMGGERHLGSVGRGGKGFGGGIFTASANLYLVNCSFDRNRSIGGQGGSAINGDAGDGGNGLGGAVCTLGGTNQMAACNLSDNSAVGGAGGISSGSGSAGIGGQGYGAGFYSESTVIATRSTISGGRAVGGMGSNPGSGYGGGIYNLSLMALSSCTIASNSASGSNFDFGGGIYNVGASLDITNSTIAGNQAAFGGGLHGNATFANTILAANTAASQGPDGQGTINSYDYNLIQNFSGVNIIGATTHVIIGQDPLLGPLADNGGPTRTMALREGSPAIDKGHSFGAVTDQRGAPRPFDVASINNAGGGDGSDIGAFELGIPRLSILRASPNVIIRWPAYFGDFVLEAVTALPGGNNWITVTNTPFGPAEQFSVTNNAASGNKFYRLKSR